MRLLERLERRVEAVVEWADEEAQQVTPSTTGQPYPTWVDHFLPHYFTLGRSQLHLDLMADLDASTTKRGQKRNYVGPRGAGKSAYISMSYPLYCACEGTEKYIILTSDTRTQAEKYLASLKIEIEENHKLREEYPELKGKSPVWTKDTVQLPTGVLIEALGTGVKLRGRRNRQHRPSLIVCDDPQNTQHVISALQRERSWSWLTQDVCNAGDAKTNIIVAGTALHPDAIVCRLEKTPGWVTRKYAAITQWPKRMDLWKQWEGILHSGKGQEEAEREARAFYEANKGLMDD